MKKMFSYVMFAFVNDFIFGYYEKCQAIYKALEYINLFFPVTFKNILEIDFLLNAYPKC